MVGTEAPNFCGKHPGLITIPHPMLDRSQLNNPKTFLKSNKTLENTHPHNAPLSFKGLTPNGGAAASGRWQGQTGETCCCCCCCGGGGGGWCCQKRQPSNAGNLGVGCSPVLPVIAVVVVVLIATRKRKCPRIINIKCK